MGKPVSKSADVYSFGILLFELVAHQIPYSGAAKAIAVAYQVAQGTVGDESC